MNVTLSQQHEAFVRQEINSGLFQSENEVVTAGLDLLQHYRSELDANILEGIEEAEAGLGEEFTPQVALDIAKEIEQEIARNK